MELVKKKKIILTNHALERLKERFPELSVDEVKSEVEQAFNEGRISNKRPSWVLKPYIRPSGGKSSNTDAIFAWPPGKARAYIIADHSETGESKTVVVTICRGKKNKW